MSVILWVYWKVRKWRWKTWYMVSLKISSFNNIRTSLSQLKSAPCLVRRYNWKTTNS